MPGNANQRAYQWFADGTEDGSVSLATANNAPTVMPNTLVLLRLAVDAATAVSLTSPRIQVCDQLSGTYVDLGNLGVNGWDGSTTPGGLLHNVACTNRLAGTGNWQAGGNTTTASNGAVNNVSIGTNSFINYLFAIQIGNIPGVTRYLRLTQSGGPISYVNVARLTVEAMLPKLANTLLSGGLLSPLVNSLGGSV
jgi:hypothetical protein